jgi:hypothetical protein
VMFCIRHSEQSFVEDREWYRVHGLSCLSSIIEFQAIRVTAQLVEVSCPGIIIRRIIQTNMANQISIYNTYLVGRQNHTHKSLIGT